MYSDLGPQKGIKTWDARFEIKRRIPIRALTTRNV